MNAEERNCTWFRGSVSFNFLSPANPYVEGYVYDEPIWRSSKVILYRPAHLTSYKCPIHSSAIRPLAPQSWDTSGDGVLIPMAPVAKQMDKQKQKQQNTNKHNDSGFLFSLDPPSWPQGHPTQPATWLHPSTPLWVALLLSQATVFSSKTLPTAHGPFQGPSMVLSEGEGVEGGLGVGTRHNGSSPGSLPRTLFPRKRLDLQASTLRAQLGGRRHASAKKMPFRLLIPSYYTVLSYFPDFHIYYIWHLRLIELTLLLLQL